MGLLAVVVVVAIVALPLGGSLAGINMAKKMMSSPYFWMSALGMLSALFAVGIVSEVVGFWPNRKVDSLDKEEDAARKKKINLAVTAVSSIGLVSSLGGLGAVAYFSLIRPRMNARRA
jgi:hypothetical protein